MSRFRVWKVKAGNVIFDFPDFYRMSDFFNRGTFLKFHKVRLL